jgi:hypothetical protein
MELGKPQRVYTIEPIEDPVPKSPPEKRDAPPPERRPEPAERPLVRR